MYIFLFIYLSILSIYLLQDPVDVSYITYEYDPSMLEKDEIIILLVLSIYLLQDPVDVSYITYEYDPSMLETDEISNEAKKLTLRACKVIEDTFCYQFFLKAKFFYNFRRSVRTFVNVNLGMLELSYQCQT